MLIGAFLPGVSCAISVNIIPLCIFQSDHQTDLYICIYRYKFIRNKSTIYLTGHFHYYLVSYNTTGVLHSSDEMTECRYKFISIHFWQINKSKITCISDFSFQQGHLIVPL